MVLSRNSARNNPVPVLAGCKSTPFGHPGKTVGVGFCQSQNRSLECSMRPELTGQA